MSVSTNLQTAIDAEITSKYLGSLPEIGNGLNLPELLDLQSKLSAITGISTASYGFSPTILASANAGVIKASAGSVFSLLVVNRTTELRYFHLVDKATTPTNSDISLSQFPFAVPPNSTLPIGKSVFGDNGLPFTSGIAWANSLTDTTITLGATTDLTIKVGYL